jgi:hypothetical protein
MRTHFTSDLLSVIILLTTLLCNVALVKAQKQGDKDKWRDIEAWTGSFSITKKISKEATEYGITEIINIDETTTGSVVLNEKFDDWNMITWYGTCTATTSIKATRLVRIGTVEITETLSGTGSGNFGGEESSVGLSIDLDEWTYGTGFCGASSDLKYYRKFDGVTKEAIDKMEDSPVKIYFEGLIQGFEMGNNTGGLEMGVGLLPANMPQEFTRMGEYLNQAMNYQSPKLPKLPGVLSGEEVEPISNTTTSWKLTPGKSQNTEYFITPVDLSQYKEYLPENNSKIKFKVYTKSKNASPVVIRFTLSEVSKEPGTCLNEGVFNDQSPDALLNIDNSGVQFYRNNDFSVQTVNEVSEAEVAVDIKDYGAYAEISAEINIAGDWYKVENDINDEYFLSIPMDENENLISDKWEKDNNIFSKNLDIDYDEENEPKLDNLNGDGLSVFEEYRGLIAIGKHNRLNPEKKDLIVENQMGQGILDGINLFQTASGIEVLVLNKNELSKDRIVNKNSKTGKFMDQYGLIIKNGKGSEPNDYGEAKPFGKLFKTPKLCTEIVIDNSALSSLPKDFYDKTVAHELGHGVGAPHHSIAKKYNREWKVNLEKGTISPRVFGGDGVEITQKGFKIRGYVSYDNGKASGDINCIMCYTNYYQWVYRRINQIEEYWAIDPEPEGKIFCTSPLATGRNLTKNGFGNAPDGGNCISKMRIKDLPR